MSGTAVQNNYSILNKIECKEQIARIDAQCDMLEGFIFNESCENQRRKYINQFLDLKEERRLLCIQKSRLEDPYKSFQ